jgi:hypothetical protein
VSPLPKKVSIQGVEAWGTQKDDDEPQVGNAGFAIYWKAEGGVFPKRGELHVFLKEGTWCMDAEQESDEIVQLVFSAFHKFLKRIDQSAT